MTHVAESGMSVDRLDATLVEREATDLGPLTQRTDIKTTIGPFSYLPEYKTEYPDAVKTALGDLYGEYNQAFGSLVEANREWGTDYQHAMTGPGGSPTNFFVQIDMVGLPDGFLHDAGMQDPEVVREVLRRRIFEIENSLAMYQLLMGVFRDGDQSRFEEGFRASLDEIREASGRQIALLAVTDEKHQSMRECEFGARPGEHLPDDEVRALSGFDKLFGPEEFRAHVEANGGESGYLLYARTSEPLAKLRKPKVEVASPLLEDEVMRRAIKASAITFNVDQPGLSVQDEAIINDTKGYMPDMRMAHPTYQDGDIFSPDFAAHLANRKPYDDYETGGRLAEGLVGYLDGQGVDPGAVEVGDVNLRGKPMKAAYGCYGHVNGQIGDRRTRQLLRKGLRERGPYVLQPEMTTPIIVDEKTGQSFTYIDRNFMAFTNGQPRFLGGFRSLMPLDSVEAQKGRVHGSSDTVWAEIS